MNESLWGQWVSRTRTKFPRTKPAFLNTEKKPLKNESEKKTKLFYHRDKGVLQPRVRVFIDSPSFIVKTVETKRERMQALRLRYDVFQREFVGKKFPIGIDTDIFDSKADILVILDKKNQQVVGTYRMILSENIKDFYSSTEFDLNSLWQLPGKKLEFSRACVHKKYRTGVIIHLLWKGLGQYIERSGADYLFGCSSVLTTKPKEMVNIYQYIGSKNYLNFNIQTKPLSAYYCQGFKREMNFRNNVDSKTSLPPLLHSYLRAGAKVCGYPALDKKYNCYDLLTVLPVSEITPAYQRKYLPKCA